MERVAADLIDGKRNWEDVIITYSNNSNLVEWCIWIISFCSWFPLLIFILSIAAYEGLYDQFKDIKEATDCSKIDINIPLVSLPLCIYPGLVIF